MKIIFESKKEKDKFLDALSKSAICPSALGFNELYNCRVDDLCRKCWKSSGLKMEVQNETS